MLCALLFVHRRLNPYSNGMIIELQRWLTQTHSGSSLNPYSNGMIIERHIKDNGYAVIKS